MLFPCRYADCRARTSKLTTIGPFAFESTKLTRLDLSKATSLVESWVEIGDKAFFATGLEGTLVIPAKLTTIDPYAFYDTKLSHKLLAKVSCKSKWKGFKLFTPTSRQLHANYSRQQFA